MEAKRCPTCSASKVLTGSIRAENGPLVFAPAGDHGTPWRLGIPLSWHTCLACGNVWTRVDAQGARATIEARGSELLKQQVERLDHGPYHDVPALAAARKAADMVAEFDDLFLAGMDLEAGRRFHDRSGATWDETIASMRGWRSLGRNRKLALCGWKPDTKPTAMPSGATDHPMADRWLDDLPVDRTAGDGTGRG